MDGHQQPARIALRAWLGGLVVALALLPGRAAAQPNADPRGGAVLPPVPPAPRVDAGAADPAVPVVSIQVRVPVEAVPGEELTYRIRVSNCSRAPAHHVTVRNPLPAGVRFVRASPEPTRMSPVLLWDLGTLAPCSRKEITLVVNPTGDAEIRSCARVQFEHGQCVRTRIARPALRLVKKGPAEAVRYDFVAYRLEVTNTGRAPARGVTLTDTLPEGLDFSDSKPPTGGENPLTWDLGDLAPGQTRAVEYKAVAKQTGSFTNRAVAEAGGGLRQQATHTVRVGQPALAVVKSGPRQRLVGRPATYQITVRNPGTMPATNVRLSDELPADIAFLRASDGGRAEGGQVRWSLGALPAGASRTVRVVVRAARAGTLKNVATATADRGLQEQGKAETLFENAVGLAVEVDKSDDPLEVGRDGTYTVRVLAAGKAPETNVDVAIDVPEGLRVIDARGPTASARAGRRIKFAALPRLAPGVELTYTLRVRAEQAGEARLEVEATSEARSVRVEETTTVRPASPPPASPTGRTGKR